jgi:hypothetical protein
MVCKAMVNDTIANVLETVGFKVVPFNSRWNTGIAFVAATESRGKGKVPRKVPGNLSGKFCESSPENDPVPGYDWGKIAEKTGMYVEIVVQTSRTLYAIL